MNQTIIFIKELSKIYKLYTKPIDCLKEALSITKRKYYKEYYALKNITFDINNGENVGIIGANGAGKSTLLKIITGVLSPTNGEISVNGKVSALLELGAGFNPDYTGIENIYLVGTMTGYSKIEVDKKVPLILEFADIGEFINQPVKTYSSGMFARLAFGVAINIESQILIVDEVLSVGDVRFQIKCMNKMKEMIIGGTTILFVSHDTNAIRRFCNKVIWLDKGEIIRYGETNAVVDEYIEFLNSGEVLKGIEDKKTFETIKAVVPKDILTQIVGFTIQNEFGSSIEEISYNEYIKVELLYDVYDTNEANARIIITIKGAVDDGEVSQFDSYSEDMKVPWKYGRNKLILEFPYGIMAISGHYYFDISIYKDTYFLKSAIENVKKEFIIKANYQGEGRVVIPHQWNKL